MIIFSTNVCSLYLPPVVIMTTLEGVGASVQDGALDRVGKVDGGMVGGLDVGERVGGLVILTVGEEVVEGAREGVRNRRVGLRDGRTLPKEENGFVDDTNGELLKGA